MSHGRPRSLLLVVVVGAATALAQVPAGGKPDARETPATTSPPVLEGVVRGPDGKAVASAWVLAKAESGAARDLLRGHSDPQGRFRIVLRSSDRLTVLVKAPGLARSTLTGVRPGSPLTVTLAKGGILDGSVRSASTGAPVADARVEVSEERTFRSLDWDLGNVVRATTDARGRFHLEGLELGPHSVTATARGLTRVRKGGGPIGSTVEIFLLTGASLAGTVRDSDGRPVAGARVEAQRESRGMVTPGPPGETTSKDGRYQIFGVPPGTYYVAARHKDFATGWVAGVEVETGVEAEADLVLSRGSLIVGRLVTTPDRPVAGQVTLRESDGQPSPYLSGLRAPASVDREGRFRLGPLPVGAHVLAITARGHALKKVDLVVASHEPTVDLGDVTMETGLTIRGASMTRRDRRSPTRRLSGSRADPPRGTPTRRRARRPVGRSSSGA